MMHNGFKTKISITHPDKILYPELHYTKLDILRYYHKVAPYMLRYIQDHPIVMHRFVHGIIQQGFYQKQIDSYAPTWLSRYRVTLKKGGMQTLVLLKNRDDLLYLVNQDVLVFHAWLSSLHAINKPDRMVFDLDPHDQTVTTLCKVALIIKKTLESYNFVPFIMTTGSRGYHIVVPLVVQHSFKQVHDFAKHIVQQVSKNYPDLCTVEMSLSKRKKRIFIDYLRNSYGQTSVVCYSLRAHETAPVATPITWRELVKTNPQKYTLKNIFRRIVRVKDPWKDFFKNAQKLPDNYKNKEAVF